MAIEVLQPGIQTTVQDYPGRVGLISRGFFPAGPMDAFAFRVANALVNNPSNAAALEITMGKFAAHFTADSLVGITGARAEVSVNGKPMETWCGFEVRAGDELSIGLARETGWRFYLAVSGGLDVPMVLGSRSTYTMGGLGGVDGRALKVGDILPTGSNDAAQIQEFPADAIPTYTHEWDIEVVAGPHASAEFLAPEDIQLLFSKRWLVDRNSNRTGIRLEPQRLRWARASGGIAGGHPSNILDNGYPVGGINLNGDTPVILGPDGPTSGGFVVVATVPTMSLWKIGQLRPGTDHVRLVPVSMDEANARAFEQEELFGLDRTVRQ